MEKKARIVERIQFGDECFKYGDIVRIIVCSYGFENNKVFIGRIEDYNDNPRPTVRLDISERYNRDTVTLDLNTIVDMNYYPERVMEE